jgi:hypothetical protein
VRMLPHVADIIFWAAEISVPIAGPEPAMLLGYSSPVPWLSCLCASDALSCLVANNGCPWSAFDGRGV